MSNKKVLSALLTAAMLSTVVLGACNKPETNSESTESSAASQQSSSIMQEPSIEGNPQSTVESSTQSSAESSVEESSETDALSLDAVKDEMAKEADNYGGQIDLTVRCPGDDKKEIMSLAKAFKEKYADSRYSLKVTVREDNADSNFNNLMAHESDRIDVVFVRDGMLETLVENNCVAKLDDAFKKELLSSKTSDSLAASSVKNELYAFPVSYDNGYFMVYDKRIFSDADTADLDNMIDIASSKKSSVFIDIGNAYYNASFFLASECNISYDMKTYAQTAALNSTEGLKAAKAMCHISEKNGAGFMGMAGTIGDDGAILSGFSSGSICAAVTGVWLLPSIRDTIGENNVGAAKLPSALIDGKQEQLHSLGGYTLMCVNSESAYPASAQALAEFITNSESQLQLYQSTGRIPTDKALLENDDSIKNDPAVEAINAQKPYNHQQDKIVGNGPYWGSVAVIGNSIYTEKGAVSDSELMKMLKETEEEVATPGTPSGSYSGNDTNSDSGTDIDTDTITDVYAPETINMVKDAMALEAKAANGTIKLEVWCSGDDAKFEKSRKKAFEEMFRDSRYKLEINIKSNYAEDTAGSKILESPENGADVFSFADDQLGALLSAKAVQQVGKIYQNNVAANNEQLAVDVCSSDGTLYAFPKTCDNGYFMYYDKRVFPNESDVENLDKMIEIANKSNKSVFMDLANGWYNAAFFFSAGCDISYKNGKQTATFNTKEGLNAAKAMCHVSEKVGAGFVGNAGTAGDNAFVQQGFADGTLAAAVIGTWAGPSIKNAIGAENVGAAKLPTALIDGRQEQLHSFGGYKVVGVNALSKFPISAQAYAYFITDEQSQLERYQERGLIPTNKKDLEISETGCDIKNDPARKAIEAQSQFAHAQGQCVSSKYWTTNIGGFGGDIVTAKGNMTDEQLEAGLAQIVVMLDS